MNGSALVVPAVVSAVIAALLAPVAAVWRGWLIPQRTVDRLEEATRRVADVHNERLRESRERELDWRRAWEISEAARAVTSDHDGDVLEAMRTLEALIRALPNAPQR